jgi:hypothetical protein
MPNLSIIPAHAVRDERAATSGPACLRWPNNPVYVAEFDRIAALSNASDDDGEPDEGV